MVDLPSLKMSKHTFYLTQLDISMFLPLLIQFKIQCSIQKKSKKTIQILVKINTSLSFHCYWFIIVYFTPSLNGFHGINSTIISSYSRSYTQLQPALGLKAAFLKNANKQLLPARLSFSLEKEQGQFSIQFPSIKCKEWPPSAFQRYKGE